MKLYAQHGFGAGDKISNAFAERLIDGVILSPRDIDPSAITAKIGEYMGIRDDIKVLIDPQFYASLIAASENARLGKLSDFPYFAPYRKSALELVDEIDSVLKNVFDSVLTIPTTAVVAPNIYISRSFDSREAVISKNFIRKAREIYSLYDDERPLFVTLAVSREALLEKSEFEEFLNDITMLKNPPDGFYVLVGSRGTDARTDIFHADVIARWMLLNYSLSVNGFQVINGYSDLVTPLLGAVGGTAGATGWWSNLRVFSLDRFQPAAGGGRLPIIRYLSVELLNRITFTEKQAVSGVLPAIVNDLPHDAEYNPEPDRRIEVLQSWEALQKINANLLGGDISEQLGSCEIAIRRADGVYAEIAESGISLDKKSSGDHLEAMREAITTFREMAGIE